MLWISRENFLKAEEAFKALGLISRLPVSAAEVFAFREEYIANKNLKAWSFYNPANRAEIVDVILTEDLAKLKVKRVRLGRHLLPIISLKVPEDLLTMFKDKAARSGVAYQTQIKRLMAEWLGLTSF